MMLLVGLMAIVPTVSALEIPTSTLYDVKLVSETEEIDLGYVALPSDMEVPETVEIGSYLLIMQVVEQLIQRPPGIPNTVGIEVKDIDMGMTYFNIYPRIQGSIFGGESYRAGVVITEDPQAFNIQGKQYWVFVGHEPAPAVYFDI